ncbi:MAG: hypothetical protein CMH55_02120 [Myxococcales bacterium]|nr:hypothetical protein [Myxococcales bacterium]|tara:strand:+ start:336 stop:812 length:477 start_codon:yes stop_codon:yes gene_type:complete
MTEERAYHLRHDQGVTITRRALAVAGFFLCLGAIASYMELGSLVSGASSPLQEAAPPLAAEELETRKKVLTLSLQLYIGGALFYIFMLVGTRWRAVEPAILGLAAWLVGRVTLRIMAGAYWDGFLFLDVLVLMGLIKGLQSALSVPAVTQASPDPPVG